ncbi:hypothetical protein DFQ27_005009, partial [Actinomortierella ambigua]
MPVERKGKAKRLQSPDSKNKHVGAKISLRSSAKPSETVPNPNLPEGGSQRHRRRQQQQQRRHSVEAGSAEADMVIQSSSGKKIKADSRHHGKISRHRPYQHHHQHQHQHQQRDHADKGKMAPDRWGGSQNSGSGKGSGGSGGKGGLSI